MTVYERAILVDAPLEDVWRFHTTPGDLEDLTPAWVGLDVTLPAERREENLAGFTVGTELDLSIRLFGIVSLGPWRSRITAIEHGSDEAWFTDEFIESPFERWVHTHRFRARGERTCILDRVEYEFPFGPFSWVSKWARPVFDGIFGYRHRRTARILES